MRKIFWAAIPALLVMAAFQAAPQSQSQTAPASRTLKVKLNYTGSGTVDAKHEILVFVFDGPDFQDGELPPIGQDQASAKDATLTFQDITSSPVYVAAVRCLGRALREESKARDSRADQDCAGEDGPGDAIV